MEHIQLMLLILFVGRIHSDNNSSGATRLIQMLQELCPGVNVCGENPFTAYNFATFGYGSCCTECSCKPTCEDNGNCCFPSKQHSEQEKTFQTERVCLFPSTVQPSAETRFKYLSYSMISKVLTKSDNKLVSSSNCGDEHIAPWGSLYPVYSVQRKQIYKNIACAASDGVEDGVVWDAELICPVTKNYLFSDANNFVQGLNSNSIPDICRVDFVYPGKTEDIQLHTCYQDLIEDCRTVEFIIPDWLNASKDEIYETCSSGLLAPYRGEEMYANVFCRICNADFFGKDATCPNPESYRDHDYEGFIALLDGNFIAEVRKGSHGILQEYSRACRIQNTNSSQNMDCRRVFCPSGQLRDGIGKCRYPNKFWYNQAYVMYIKFTLEEKIDMSEEFQKTNILSNIKSPWQDDWITKVIFLENTAQLNNISHFVAIVLKAETSKVNPGTLMKNIKKMVNASWVFRNNNKTINMMSRFWKYSYTVFSRKTESVIDFGNHLKTYSMPFYQPLQSTGLSDSNLHIITKLYLCDQIELVQPDIILSKDRRILYNSITKKYLFKGEFSLMTTNSFEGLRARVCLEDSGYYRTDNVTFSVGSQESKTYYVLLAFAVFLL